MSTQDDTCRTHYSNERFRAPRRLVEREAYILEQCRGRRVLDVGCVASYAFQDQIKDGTWLHGKIRSVASGSIGVDIAEAAVDMLRDEYGMADVISGDACHLDELGIGYVDLVVASEIIEHLTCPGLMLESIRKVLTPRGRLLITAPNAFCARRFLAVLIGRESVHRDHLAYYSCRTLLRIGEMYGYRVIDQAMYRLASKRPLLSHIIEQLACACAPCTSEGVICLMEKA